MIARVSQAATYSGWSDRLRVTPAPTVTDLVREYRGISGACALLNSNSVANTPFGLFRGEDNESPEVEAHPFLDTLHKPNPHMGTKLLWKTTQLYLETCGEAYWRIVSGVLNPCVEIWPLQPQLTDPIMGIDNQITGWTYDKQQLSLDEVVPFYCTDPLNPYGGGKGPAELAWSEIVLMNSDTAMMTALMQNGGAPGYVMSPKDSQGVVSQSLLVRLYAAWDTFKGKGSKKLMIPEVPVDIQTLAQTSKEFEGSARYEQLKSVIMACYNIPSALFASAGTRAELDAALVQHARLAIDPRTALLEDVVNRKVMALYDDKINLFFEQNLLEDQSAQPVDEQGLPTGPNPSGRTRMNQGADNANAAA